MRFLEVWLVLAAFPATAGEPALVERYAGRVHAQAEGDLNGDGQPDLVLVVQHQPTDAERKSSRRYDEWMHDDLLVFLSGPDGLTLTLEKPNWWSAFGAPLKSGSVPLLELAYREKQLVIEVDDPSDENGDERLTFRWDRDALVLTTQVQSQNPRMEYRGLTGRISVKKTTNWLTGVIELQCDARRSRRSKTKPRRLPLHDFELQPVDLAEACGAR